jgi:hypothetical protein
MNGYIDAHRPEQEWLRIAPSAGSNTSSIPLCTAFPPTNELCN